MSDNCNEFRRLEARIALIERAIETIANRIPALTDADYARLTSLGKDPGEIQLWEVNDLTPRAMRILGQMGAKTVNDVMILGLDRIKESGAGHATLDNIRDSLREQWGLDITKEGLEKK